MAGVCLSTSYCVIVNSATSKYPWFMWLVEENTNHGVLFFGEHPPGRNTKDNRGTPTGAKS